MASVYENVQKLCAERGISMTALEEKAEIAHGITGKWKKAMPNITTLQKVAKTLDVKLVDLLEGVS